MKEAIEFHVEVMRMNGEVVPAPTTHMRGLRFPCEKHSAFKFPRGDDSHFKHNNP